MRTTAQLREDGYGPTEVARLLRNAELVRIRRGAYAWAESEQDARAVHRALVKATLPALAPDTVLSHRSAAVLHDLPLLGPIPRRVEVTRAGARGGKNRGGVHLHAASLAAADVVELDGILLTSTARTVVDLARALPFEQAVVPGDAALRLGLNQRELSEALDCAHRRPGIAAARRAVAFLDGRSESVGESRSRVLLHQEGLPAPEPQLRVLDENGRFVARCDFGWARQRVIGEFDGRIKYGRLLRPGQDAGDAVFDEKRREDALRELGWLVIRWIWADLADPGRLAARLQSAFARSARL